jgi:hypothetical protein
MSSKELELSHHGWFHGVSLVVASDLCQHYEQKKRIPFGMRLLVTTCLVG